MKNKTGTLPAIGPFSKPKKQPPRSTAKCIVVKCGEKPGNRRVVLAPAESFAGWNGLYL